MNSYFDKLLLDVLSHHNSNNQSHSEAIIRLIILKEIINDFNIKVETEVSNITSLLEKSIKSDENTQKSTPLQRLKKEIESTL